MSTIPFVVGLACGILVLAVLGWTLAPKLMLKERRSPHSLEETVRRIVDAAEREGWVVNAVRPLDESVREHGGPEVDRVRLVELCHPDHAGRILRDDRARIASVMMPCTISVYEHSDGTTRVGSMNPGVIGRVFGGVIADVMAGPVADEQAKFVRAVG